MSTKKTISPSKYPPHWGEPNDEDKAVFASERDRQSPMFKRLENSTALTVPTFTQWWVFVNREFDRMGDEMGYNAPKSDELKSTAA